ncbi:hypothetical protein CDD80_6047 [Ophiocordyceps camponoti-rufipedis]|uniref:J domain-containing protein n=1 Tax=Ophiocordyceps camponoti-rufipedis TaxID=2004952 RepID=A0A2C5YU13_9HYPO|nr:hypothetical protein CDD80_6047 [Ophiocordyceps camponoti-rufipedis]
MPPLPPDPYKILGVAKDAQIPDIRSAHRKLVLKCHPDKVQDPRLKAEKQDEFQKVQQAYELLSDEAKRRKYDDQVRLLELCMLYQAKANTGTPRTAPKEFNIYTAEPQSPTARNRPPPHVKGYTFRPSWDDDVSRGPRIFDTGPSRRETSYGERPTKRELERERERNQELSEREKERQRRRKAQEESRRLEREAKEAKEAKELRRAERKHREKMRDKELRREADDKKRSNKPPYIEPIDDPFPPSSKSDKKKTGGGKRYEDNRRDRSSGREEEAPSSMPPLSAPQRSYTTAMDYAQSYIERTKNSGPPGLQRSKTYQPGRNVNAPVPAPTPPPTQGPAEDDGRRSGGKFRRSSADAASAAATVSAKPRSHRDEAAMPTGSPPTRHTAQFAKSAVGPGSPPRRELHRSGTAPLMEGGYGGRPPPGVQRSQTMSGFPESAQRGRDRSRMQPQIDEESDPEDVTYHMRKQRVNRDGRVENVSHYQIDGGRTKFQSQYSRRLDADGYYSGEGRPGPSREGSSYMPTFTKVKTSKRYDQNDIKWSSYYEKPSHRSTSAAYA